MKATSAALHYGRSVYPVADVNLPDVALVDDMIAAVLLRMSTLAGGFTLAPPEIVNIEIIGDGYGVRFGDFAAEKAVAEALGTILATSVEKDRIIAALRVQLSPSFDVTPRLPLIGSIVETADRLVAALDAEDFDGNREEVRLRRDAVRERLVEAQQREHRYPRENETRCAGIPSGWAGCVLLAGHVGAHSL